MEVEEICIKFAKYISKKKYILCSDDTWIQNGTGEYPIVANNTKELYEKFLNDLQK